MKKNPVVIGIAGLILGLGMGYAVASSISSDTQRPPQGMHEMPDGTIMGNGGMSMEDMMRDMNATLVGKTGDAFDQSFLAEMIVHHQGAVGMAEAALKNAKHQEIKDLANAIITAQNQEVGQMQAWQQAWYGR